LPIYEQLVPDDSTTSLLQVSDALDLLENVFSTHDKLVFNLAATHLQE